jgi:hypothetical protein
VIADPIALDRVIAEAPEPKFVTFINPQPDNGVAVFARIALELGALRPEIPILRIFRISSPGTSPAANAFVAAPASHARSPASHQYRRTTIASHCASNGCGL